MVLRKGERKLESGEQGGGRGRGQRERNQEREGGKPQPGGCPGGWRGKEVGRGQGWGGLALEHAPGSRAWELQQEPRGRGCSLSFTK